MHPSGHGLPHALLESEAESAVAAVAALVGELLGREGLPGSGSLATEIHEVVDAQVVDIGVVMDALLGEILAEIEAVGANGLCESEQGKVVLQV